MIKSLKDTWKKNVMNEGGGWTKLGFFIMVKIENVFIKIVIENNLSQTRKKNVKKK